MPSIPPCVPALILLCALASPSAPAASTLPPSTPPPPPSSTSDLPEAPVPQQGAGSPAPQPQPTSTQGHQTKRILGIVPNFRSVSANTHLPPQSPGEKFKTVFQDSFDYSAIIFAAGQAGVAQAENSYPAFRQGAAGYGRYFWHTFADQTDENIWVEGILPVTFHQDNRYYTLGSGGLVHRAAYAFSRIAITRQDSGREAPNVSEILGAGASSSISGLYYPGQYRTWTKIGQRWLTNVIIDGVTFTAKEFWPDINDAIFHQKD
jgi:hypothetical protein